MVVGRLKVGKNKQRPSLIPLTEDDKKLFSLTKNNTLVNRDITHKEKNYLKNAQPQYQEIYGNKGVKFCQEEEKNEKKEPNKKGKVKFSSIIEYSRN